MSDRLILAIETSCDETAVAILRGRDLLASEVASQTELHAEFGGVVPEVASRNHLRVVRSIIDAALAKAGVAIVDMDAFAATRGPGLATSLMIGVSVAKGLSLTTGRPYIGINHVEGHLLSPFFPGCVEPAIGLVVSGGHTLLIDIEDVGKYRRLGGTVDDAAGEAFDKVGKMLGLPYPGGPLVDRMARDGDPAKYDLPRSMIDSDDYAFSFSGLKTAVRYLLPKLPTLGEAYRVEDVCASFQEAVVDVLVSKALRAVAEVGRQIVALSGGVSCNSRLRERFEAECMILGLDLRVAEPALCTDNAVMIAYTAALRLARQDSSPLTQDIDPNLRLV
jgi:N6-L-threonylcarbamoyladenine synthase